MALSGQPGWVQAQISVRIHAPLEFFHSSLYSSPLMGGTTPARRLLLPTPYSFQLGPMKEIQYSASTLESIASGPISSIARSQTSCRSKSSLGSTTPFCVTKPWMSLSCWRPS